MRRVLLGLLCLGGCDSTSDQPAELDGGAEASATVDASDDATPDAGEDAAVGCPSSSGSFDDGVLVAPSAARPVVIDGDLGEWSCAKFFHWDKTSAGYIGGSTTDSPNAYELAVSWKSDMLYVALRAFDPDPDEGNDVTDPYQNDAVEIFLGGETVFGTSYTPTDRQLVVDYLNRAKEYQNGPAHAVPASFQSSVKKTDTGYTYEMAIGAIDLGRTVFTPRTHLGFSAAGDDSNGTAQETWMLWYRPPVAQCDAGCCNVYCNPMYFGELVLIE